DPDRRADVVGRGAGPGAQLRHGRQQLRPQAGGLHTFRRGSAPARAVLARDQPGRAAVTAPSALAPLVGVAIAPAVTMLADPEVELLDVGVVGELGGAAGQRDAA